MTHPVNNETPDLDCEGATLSKFIHKGRPSNTKPTFVALPSLTCHSTFCECLRGILCQPRDSPHSPLTRPIVIISYSLCLERKITLPSISIICWNTTMESTPKKLIYSTSRSSTTFQVTNSYGSYTTSPATKITSAIIEGKIDKRLQFQVNRLNIARDTSIETRKKIHSKILNFYISSITLTLT